jgi:GNAT superfamily N-acetyltransferase
MRAIGGADNKRQSSPVVSVRPSGAGRVVVRAIAPNDAEELQAYVRSLSRETRRNRFLGALAELAPAQLERMSRMSGPTELMLLAFADVDGERRIVAEAALVIAADSRRSEIALSVADAWQGQGLGMLLLRHLECHARAHGARYLFGDVLRTNTAMKCLARKAGFSIRSPFTDARLVEVVKDLATPAVRLPCPDVYAGVRNTTATGVIDRVT